MAISYILSFAKESVVAYYFGLSEATDAYTIATQIPVLLFSCISVAIQSVVVPLYSDLYYKKSEEDASAFIHQLLTLLLLIRGLLLILGEVFSSGVIYLFAPGFGQSTHNLATKLLQIIWPTILFTVVSQVYTAILNVHKRFIGPAFAVYFLNGLLIVCIVLLYKRLGIVGACVGQLVGGFANYLYLRILIHKIYKYHPVIDLKDHTIKQSLKMTMPIFWSISVAEINAMVNRAVASFLFIGSIAALNYASKVNSVLSSFALSAITSIVYPLYAESAAKEDMSQLNSRVNLTLSAYVYLLMPLMIFIIVYNEDIIRIAFARGAFDYNAVAQTSVLLCCYAIGLPFMAFRTIVTKIFYSLKDTNTPAINATIGVVLNIVLNVTLPFIMGLKGLALATSITACFISLRLLYLLIKKHQALNLAQLFSNLKPIIITNILLLMVLFGLLFVSDSLPVLLRFLIGGLASVIIYFLLSLVFRIPVFNYLVKQIKQ